MNTKARPTAAASFADLEARLKLEGFRPDSVWSDRMIIETTACPKCRKRLNYTGLSNAEQYYAFGHCPCGWIQKFLF